MATEAARLEHKKKDKTALTLTGLLMEGVKTLKDVTGRVLSSKNVTSQGDAPIRGAPLGVFPVPIVLYQNRNAIPVPADKS